MISLLQSSVGPQPDSTVPNPGSMTFGTAQRLPKPGKDGVPGPGHYRVPPALGEQKESKRATLPRAVFGTSTRDDSVPKVRGDLKECCAVAAARA